MSENIYNKSHKLDITAKQAIDNADKFLFEDKKRWSLFRFCTRWRRQRDISLQNVLYLWIKKREKSTDEL